MDFLIIFAAKYLFIIILLVAGGVGFMLKKGERNALIKQSILAFPLSFVLTTLAGMLLYDPRPFVTEHIQPLIEHISDNGFPSDHTVLVLTTALLVFTYNRKVGSHLILLGLVVGIARIMAKIHSPIDILGSIVVATLSVYTAQLILNKVKPLDSLLSSILMLVAKLGFRE